MNQTIEINYVGKCSFYIGGLGKAEVKKIWTYSVIKVYLTVTTMQAIYVFS